MAKKDNGANTPIIVVGLGRFGSAVAHSPVRLGHEVLAGDENVDIVQRLASEFTHVVAADTTDTEALRQIGAEQFDRAVVGIGTDIEASVLTVLSLVELGVTEVLGEGHQRQARTNPREGRRDSCRAPRIRGG